MMFRRRSSCFSSDGAKHSIWQLTNHIAFWREYCLRLMSGEPRDEQLVKQRNWEGPSEVNQAAWDSAVENLTQQQQAVYEAMGSADEKQLDRLRNIIEHDAYHMGQIMLLRAMQGMPPLDTFES